MKQINNLVLKTLLVVISGVFISLHLITTVSATTASDSAQSSASVSASQLEPPLLPIPEQALNVSLSPVSLTLETRPGELTQREVKIRNNSAQPEQLLITMGSFIAGPDGETPQLTDPDPNDPSRSWLSVDEQMITIQPGEWKTVKVTFTPPPEAALSYYYTLIFTRAQTTQNTSTETKIQGAPALLVLATATSPNAKRELELVSTKARWPLTEYLPQIFDVTIKNTGNVYVVPAGNIFIDGQGEKDVSVLSLNPGSQAILPGTERTYSVVWTDGFPLKILPDQMEQSGMKVGNTRWDWSEADQFRLGQYTGHVLLVYDNGQRDIPLESFVGFWVIPWKLLLLTLAVFVLLGIGIWSIGRGIWLSWRRLRSSRSGS